MNLSGRIVLVLLLISAPVIALCQVANISMVKLTAYDSGKRLSISKGRVFTLTLPDHVDGGYRFDTPQYDKSVLQLLKHVDTPPDNNGRLGEPGHDVWQFIALKKGNSILKITESRPWAKKDIIIIFSSIVLVK